MFLSPLPLVPSGFILGLTTGGSQFSRIFQKYSRNDYNTVFLGFSLSLDPYHNINLVHLGFQLKMGLVLQLFQIYNKDASNPIFCKLSARFGFVALDFKYSIFSVAPLK